jgi:alkaline phosphatase
MKNNTMLNSFRSRLRVPGLLTVGVLALSQALCVPTLFAGSTTDESKSAQMGANRAKLNSIKLQSYQLPPTRAKNVILFVGDGMGISTITAARILEGQNKGLNGTLGSGTYAAGEQNLLSFEGFPNAALSRTYSVNQQVSDSAPTMTAMVSGVKNNDGALSVTADVVRGNDHSEAQKLATILEQVKMKGMSAGIVSTARVTHATPAATYAHASERNWECDSNFTTSNGVAAGRTPQVKDIAAQLLDCNGGRSLDVVLGGGRYYFMKNDQADPEYTYLKGKRLSVRGANSLMPPRDLISEWKKLPNRVWNLSTGTLSTASYPDNPRSAYVWNKAQFDTVKAKLSEYDRLLGLFEPSHVQYEADRANDVGGEPSLSEMATTAVDFLSKNRNGYFLMVEGGRIDHAHHAGNAYRALTDTIAFSDAIRDVAAKVSSDTLIVVTADHSHTFTIAGYPVRGNPILGLVTEPGFTLGAQNTVKTTVPTDMLGLPYTTLGYANGPGYTGASSQYTYSVTSGTIATVNGATVVTGSALASPLTNVAQGSKFGFVNMLVPTDSGGFSSYAGSFSGITTSGSLAGRPSLTLSVTSNPNYLQESAVPLQSETHGGEDVAIFAKGPNAHLFRGTLEQSMIYWIMADALRLNP